MMIVMILKPRITRRRLRDYMMILLFIKIYV